MKPAERTRKIRIKEMGKEREIWECPEKKSGLAFREMVEVFRTNVQGRKHAKAILAILMKHFPSFKINFDLSDCDNILRVQGNNLNAIDIIELMGTAGYRCELLD